MKRFSFLVLCQALLAAATPYGSKLPVRQQGNSFAGVNSFFLHAFKQCKSQGSANLHFTNRPER
ncbi:hypothetical protein LB505_003019 [Fusarium chuoi]|nr:hypothetical protein LB505_003019 [Fusarium chuoi]